MDGQNKGRSCAMNKILIIDDDRELCALIKRSVQAENIESDFCNTGKEGLQKLKEQEYQLVILDVMMPHLDGFSVCKMAREMSNLPIIMLTAKSEEEDKLKAAIKANEERLVRLNAFDYVSLDEEQKKLQKELVRQQNVRQLTESQEKVKTEIVRLEKETVDCSMQLTEQEATRKTIQRLYENARMAVGKDVKALRQQLQEGEACPVCGSTSHPYHREQEVVDILFRNIEQEYNAVVIACQQTNNQHIALQRDLAHQRTVIHMAERRNSCRKRRTDTEPFAGIGKTYSGV